MIPYQNNVEVGHLIGLTCSKAIKPKEIIPGREDEPYAMRTALGCGVIGVIDPNRSVHTEGYDVSVNRVISREAESEGQARIRFSLNTKIKEVVNPNQINKMMEQDFSECKSEGRALSHEVRVFLKMVNDGIQKLDDGHYEIPLPFK